MDYVLGCVFDPTSEDVLLIRKLKPLWQRGKVNLPGGKIEDGERPVDAVKREIKEETGLIIPEAQWTHFLTLSGTDFTIFVFFAFHSNIYEVQRNEEENEEVFSASVSEIKSMNVMNNLPWMLEMARFSNPTDWPYIVTEKVQ